MALKLIAAPALETYAGETTPLKEEHTPDHRNCPGCSRAIQLHADAVPLTPDLTFKSAFDLWISRRVIDHAGTWTNARYISPRTEKDLRQYAKEAGRFFDHLRLEEIHAGHLRIYQQARAVCDQTIAAWKKRAGANLIRKEVEVVVRVMRAAGAWGGLHEENHEPLQAVEADEERALTPQEQDRWLKKAASRESWRVVYWYSLVALQTTAATNEMRGIRLGDVYLEQGTLQIREGKNRERVRRIPLQTPEVVWALDGLVARARRLGAGGHHCYLFPRHITGDRYDPLRPMSVWGLRKPWDEVRVATGLKNFTPYHTRHTALTRMAEKGAPVHVMMAYAGHISPRMQQRYIAISDAAKREWAARTWSQQHPALAAPQTPAPPQPQLMIAKPVQSVRPAAYWTQSSTLVG